VKSSGFRNKLTGKYFAFKDSKEILLTFSDTKARIEIPWWNFVLGKDNDASPPEKEEGYLKGYHLQNFSEDEKWGKTLNLYLRKRKIWPVFNGYAWFRQWFELPKEANGEDIIFCLGGYNQEDWSEYWVFVNGVPIGQRSSDGRWRTPGEFAVSHGSREYSALKFGEKNLLAVRTHHLNKRFGGVSDDILERFVFDANLVDQFVASGKPYLYVSDFKLKNWKKEGTRENPRLIFELYNGEQKLKVLMRYELDGFMRRKWFEIKNNGEKERLLLDVDVDDVQFEASISEGDYGYPVIIDDEVFCAIEHPAGVNMGMQGRIRLRHFPGLKLASGQSVKSKVSIWGVAPTGRAREQFIDYLQERSPRNKKALAICMPFGINDMFENLCPTLNEEQMLDELVLLEKWQKKGFKFDYYVLDYGWQDHSSDLTRFRSECFPNGPQKVVKRVNELGMKFGLWFASTWGDWSCGLNPKVEPSRAVVPGGEWPQTLYRNGFLVLNSQRQLCLACEPYFSILRDAILHHIRNNNLRFFKLDVGDFYCNSTTHQHLPGKYSTEADYDRLIEISEAARRENKDVFVMWYWGIRSPFFALYGDSIFENRLTMEAASTGDYPALFFRDAVNLALDQGSQFAEFVPPLNKDSLGVWIAETQWGNFMRKERWQEALIMDLARGNLLFPQLWGNLYLFDEEDLEYLVRINKLVKKNVRIFLNRKNILGDPWKNEVYGYSYFKGAHGFIFVNNIAFQERPVTLKLTEEIGLKAVYGTPLMLRIQFPTRDILVRNGKPIFKSGESITMWLRPFEVNMIEVLPTEKAKREIRGFGRRELPAEKPEAQSLQIKLEIEEAKPEMEVQFADADKLIQTGYEKRITARCERIPQLDNGEYTLAVIIRMLRNGKWWRNQRPSNLLQIKAVIGDETVRFEAVPSHKQYSNNQWAPWLVFKTPMGRSWSGKDFKFAIIAYLPKEVNISEEAWIVPNWWKK